MPSSLPCFVTPGEEGGQAPELLALPAGERVVVALGAFEPDAEERPRGAGGEVLGLGVLGDVVGQRRRLGRGIEGVPARDAPARRGGP